jgi:predicted adenylyl cyclase CyaB
VRNLEFKARIDDPKPLTARAREIGFDLWGDLRQVDTYFEVPRGRLKLRETTSFPAELILYKRDEAGGARPSDYEKTSVADAAALKTMLTAALGVRAVVRKRRTLLLLDTTRMHLDNVEGLGWFLEFEVPVRDGDEAAAVERLEMLLRELSFTQEDGIRASYVDLISATTSSLEH